MHIFVWFWGRTTAWPLLVSSRLICTFKSVVTLVNSLPIHYFITTHWFWHFVVFFGTLLQFRTNLILSRCSNSMIRNRHDKHDVTLVAVTQDTIYSNLSLTVSTDQSIELIASSGCRLSNYWYKNSFTVFFHHIL